MDDTRHITGVTLVDITQTGVIRNSLELEKERNQQRNWETVIQCIGLRTQPMDILGPVSTTYNLDSSVLGEMYAGIHKIWVFTFSVDREGIWQKDDDPLYYLNQDFNEVPVVMGLDESARFMLPIFFTSGAIKNIYFKLGRIDLNTI